MGSGSAHTLFREQSAVKCRAALSRMAFSKETIEFVAIEEGRSPTRSDVNPHDHANGGNGL